MAFGVMPISRIAVRRKTRHDRLEISAYIGVGVLAEDERSARVLKKHGAETFADAALGDDLRDLVGDVRGAPAGRVEGEGGLVEHGRSRILEELISAGQLRG